jgi:chromate transporter
LRNTRATRWVLLKGFRLFHPPSPGFAWRTQFTLSKGAVSQYRNQRRSRCSGGAAGIFLPGFLFVAASRPLIPRIRRSKTAAAFLDGVNVGAVALMIAVTWQLSRAALIDFPTGAIAAFSVVVLIYFRINSAWLIFTGGLVGLVATRWLGA